MNTTTEAPKVVSTTLAPTSPINPTLIPTMVTITKNGQTIDLVATEQKRSKTDKEIVGKVDKDGKAVLDADGKQVMEEVKVAAAKETYPFLQEKDQTIDRMNAIFGAEIVLRQTIAAFSRIFQLAYFNTAEKDLVKFKASIEAEDIGSTRERTSKTVMGEITKLKKENKPENKAQIKSLLVEWNELTEKELEL